MELIHTKLGDLLIIKPKVFEDERGYFFESYRESLFDNVSFVQDNESKSNKDVLRGLHFQKPPFAQGKLVKVVKGAVLDVAVDIRKNSKTFGQWEAIEINESNKLIIYIPEGFAHGFRVLEDNTIFQYKCTNYYNPESEGSLRWNDPDLNIDWGSGMPVLSDKDAKAPFFKKLVSPF